MFYPFQGLKEEGGEGGGTDLEGKRQICGVCPAILLPIESRRRLASMARIQRDEVVAFREAGILKLRGEPGRVKKLRMEEEDGRLCGIEAANGAGRGIGDVPKRSVVVVRVWKVDVRHICLSVWPPQYLREREFDIVVSRVGLLKEAPPAAQPWNWDKIKKGARHGLALLGVFHISPSGCCLCPPTPAYTTSTTKALLSLLPPNAYIVGLTSQI